MPEIHENTYAELSDIEDGAFERGEDAGYKRGLLEAARMAEEAATGWRNHPHAGPGYRAMAKALAIHAARLRARAEE